MVLPDDIVDAELESRHPRWRREGREIVREDTCEGFVQAIQWVGAVAELAEDHDHHPDIDIRYNRVVLRLTTHFKGGLTQRDLDLAGDIDAMPAPTPPRDDRGCGGPSPSGGTGAEG